MLPAEDKLEEDGGPDKSLWVAGGSDRNALCNYNEWSGGSKKI